MSVAKIQINPGNYSNNRGLPMFQDVLNGARLRPPCAEEDDLLWFQYLPFQNMLLPTE